MPYAEFPADIHGEIVIFGDFHPFQSGRGLSYYLHFPFGGEMSFLVDIDSDGDYHLIEHCQCPFQNIEMPCRKRVERTRKKRFTFHLVWFIAASR